MTASIASISSFHMIIDGHYIDAVKVHQMDAKHISYEITGQVEVELQYGPNSDVKNDIGLRHDDAYPYHATVNSVAAKPLEIGSDDIDLAVDNSSFYE